MRLTSRFLAYLPRPGADAGEADAARARGVAARTGLTIHRSDPWVFAAEDAASGPVEAAGAADPFVLDVYPGTAASGRGFSAGAEPDDWAARHATAEREAQFYNLIEATERGLRIESDPIGLKPFYVAELERGTVIASRVLDILRAFPSLTTPADPAAAYQLMMFRAPMADRTLHRRLRRSISGGCYAWSPEAGLQVSRARRLQVPPVDAGLFVDDALARIKAALVRSVEARTAGLSGPICLALSGGFDSRLLAAVAVELGLPVEAYSFGRRYHPEIQSAKATAGALGIPLRVLPYPTDGSIQRLPLHLETVEGTADLATSLIANLFAIERPVGAPLLHGFCGDPLAGSLLRHLTPQEYGSLDRVADGVMRTNGGSSAVDFAGLLHADSPVAAIREEVRANLLEGAAPHQAYALWHFEHRQRRYTTSHFPMLGTRFDTIAPLYDRALFDLWFSVPPMGLDGRSLFRKFLAKHYPALARIPHSEETGPITPNLRHQVPRFLRQAPYAALDRVMGAGWSRGVLRSRSRDRYIWSLANLAGSRQRAHMLARIGALRPEVGEMLGLEVDAAFAERLRGDLQATRGLFLIAEYAAWLKRRIAAAG